MTTTCRNAACAPRVDRSASRLEPPGGMAADAAATTAADPGTA